MFLCLCACALVNLVRVMGAAAAVCVVKAAVFVPAPVHNGGLPVHLFVAKQQPCLPPTNSVCSVLLRPLTTGNGSDCRSVQCLAAVGGRWCALWPRCHLSVLGPYPALFESYDRVFGGCFGNAKRRSCAPLPPTVHSAHVFNGFPSLPRVARVLLVCCGAVVCTSFMVVCRAARQTS